MLKRIEVPEPDEQGYTTEQIRRIVENYKRRTGKLPYGDPVEVPPLKNPAPSKLDRIWANKWNLVGHFIVDGGGAAIAAFTATKDLTVSGMAFVVGGVVGAARKGIDDSRRAAGKADMVSAVLRRPVTTEGAEVNPIVTMLIGSLDSLLVMLQQNLATTDEERKYMKAIAWNVIFFEAELRGMAAKTETTYDDAFVTELVEAANTIYNAPLGDHTE